MTVEVLTHNRVSLALYRLRGGGGRPLLMLHGLGERSPADVPTWIEAWHGPVVALDFTGHGASSIPVGGGYTAEILLADADTALAALGEVTVIGRGLGSYVALQLAGSRPAAVRGAILCDGPGLAGGATNPTTQSLNALRQSTRTPDMYALLELSRDLRPPDYAATFVRLAVAGSPLDEPITVTTTFRPPWVEAVAAEPGVAVSTVADALARYAST